MIKKFFAVYDIKSLVFSSPFLAVNSDCALRSFANAANDFNSDINRNPADYILYEIGSFDDTTCQIVPLPERLYMGTALQYVTNPNPIPEVIENV